MEITAEQVMELLGGPTEHCTSENRCVPMLIGNRLPDGWVLKVRRLALTRPCTSIPYLPLHSVHTVNLFANTFLLPWLLVKLPIALLPL